MLKYVIGVNCLTDGVLGYSLKNCDSQTMTLIEGYRSYYLGFLNKLYLKGHSMWSISCSWHATSIFDPFYSGQLQKIPEETGTTM